RHTSSERDWSSDVCSSDLAVATVLPLASATNAPVISSASGSACSSSLVDIVCSSNENLPLSNAKNTGSPLKALDSNNTPAYGGCVSEPMNTMPSSFSTRPNKSDCNS